MPRYRNTESHPRQGLAGFLRWQLERIRGTARHGRQAMPAGTTTSEPLPAADRPPPPVLTWIGHSTYLLEIGGARVLTDPHFSRRAAPSQAFGPRRLVPLPLSIDELPPLDLVLVSHNHYDHLDRGTLRQLAAIRPPTRVVVPPGLARKVRRWGLETVRELGWWEHDRVAHERGHLGVRAVPVQHSSCRWGPDRDRTGWNGYVVEIGDFRFFFAGDTGYSRDFRDIRRRLGPIDLAALPIGAYEPCWFMRHVHASPEEAVEIHLDLEARRSVAMHWGTFRLTDEPLDEPPRRLRRALDDRGIDPRSFLVLAHGESLRL